ncbi:MAG: DUF2752 domain-containing protein [Flavobacteriaceae bacterium]|nr:DUF2752 domain-containing protein [Psychroflexus sp.]
MSKSLKIFIYTGLSFITIAALSLYLNYNPTEVSFFPQCPFHYATGLHCPGCGTQRAIHDILNGDILSGIQHNVLIVLAIAVLSYNLFILLRQHFHPHKTKNLLYHKATPMTLFFIIIFYWIGRNIPIEPFTFLAP